MNGDDFERTYRQINNGQIDFDQLQTRRSAIPKIIALAGGLGAVAFGAKNLIDWRNNESELTEIGTTELPSGINGPADVSAGAVRGNQFQATETVPLARNWVGGAFITRVLLPDGTLAFSFTIDDGPSPYNTEPMLRVCERLGIRATWFLIGVNVLAFPDIARRIRDAGHEIGNHSETHSPYSAYPLSQQVEPTQRIIMAETGVWPVANRAPGKTRGDIILQVLASLGMYELHTTLEQNDWQSPRWNEDSLVAELEREFINGGIGLYHDGGGLRPTNYAWERLVNVALSQGFQCVTATELINMGTPLPGRNSYSQSIGAETPQSAGVPEQEETFVDRCGYDPIKEFQRRLDDPHTEPAEASRIKDVMLYMRDLEKDSS